jgi:hypothetical protein
MTMIRNEMNTNDNNGIRHLEYMKWMWIWGQTEWNSFSPRRASEATKIWQDACKDIQSYRKRKDLLCIINNKVLQIIAREQNFDCHQRNQDIRISIFSNSRITKFLHFKHIWNVHNSTGWRKFRRRTGTRNNTVCYTRYIKLLWKSWARKWVIRCPNLAGRSTKIWQRGCRDI